MGTELKKPVFRTQKVGCGDGDRVEETSIQDTKGGVWDGDRVEKTSIQDT